MYSFKACSLEKVLDGTSLPYSPPSGEVKISWALAQGVTVAGIPFEGNMVEDAFRGAPWWIDPLVG